MSWSIALDGPAGVGKSTIASLLAERLNFVHVDTGAMYRALSVYFTDLGIQPSDEKAMEEALPFVEVTIDFIDGKQHVFVNGKDVTDRLRTQKVSEMASVCSQYKAVRQKLLELQRSLAASRNVIMDGRDIGTVVLPHATLKIFLTARPEIRAMRRFLQLKQDNKLGEDTFDSIFREISERDYRDSHRENAPLCAAEDGIVVDTSDKGIEEVASVITDLLEKKKKTEC